jgi:uncharacterized membrane protein YphA (DoxX/SURF4 family)
MDASNDTTVVSVWKTFRLVFGLVPIVAGLDKFTNLLVYWPKYLAPVLARALPMSPHSFMLAVGVIEIVAGLGVLLSPWSRTFGYVVAAWLTGIAINLIAAGYFDIAVRDLVMAVTAVSFARLGAVVPQTRHARRPLEHARASGV